MPGKPRRPLMPCLHWFSLALAGLGLLLAALLPAIPAASAGGVSFSPGASLRFEHFTLDSGLSQDAVLALLQDNQGYLWIGTQDGLDRYDGYSFTHFKNDPKDPGSISFNSIISLYQDSDGNLWIGTWGGGLNRYDPASGKFIRYLPDPKDPASLVNPVVTSIVQDKVGRLWVGTLGGLELFDPVSGRFALYRTNADPASLSSNAISAIYPSPDGTLWIGTGAFGAVGNGLNHLDPATGKVERLGPFGDCLRSLNVSSIASSSGRDLWIGHGGSGLPGGGLDHYNPANGSCQHYDQANTAGRITNDNVTRLLFDRDGRLWITIWGGGLVRMEAGLSGIFYNIRHDPADPESLASDNLSTLLQDRSNVLWVGTYDFGLEKLNLENLQFRTYKNNLADPNSLASDRVSAFAGAPDGSMWIGTSEAGLDHFDPRTGAFTHYRNVPSNSASLSSSRIMSLYADADGTVWVGTYNSGLNHFDPASGEFTRYQHDSSDPGSLIDDEVTYITRDNAGSLWIATMGGLSRFDAASQTFSNYTGLSGAPVTLLPDGGDLWIGTWGGGVSRLSLALPGILPASGKPITTLINMSHDATDPNSLSENSVWAIHKSSDGLLWFGTADGLNQYNPHTGLFKIYNEANGLRNASISCITEDRSGFLWIATADGLARFDPQSEKFRLYDKSSGLQGDDFNDNACYANPVTGEIYVGGTNGFTVFDPAALTSNSLSPSAVITDFSVLGTPYPFDPQGQTPIRLGYTQNSLAFSFAGLDFQVPENNQYAYKLEGFDHDWVQAGRRHTVSYSDLPTGTYYFHVIAANSDGTWGTREAVLQIEIAPPFWKRWQYQAGLIGACLALVAGGFWWRLSAVRANALKLEQRIAERTEQLNRANELLRQKAAQDAVSAERTRLARELHDAVTQTLFSATLIADVLPDLWARNTDEGNRRLEELRQLTRGALAEMRTLLAELRPNALVEVPLPTLLRQLAEAMVGRARIDIQVYCSGERKLPADVQVGLYRIAQEALNNVVKHSKASQAVITLRMDEPVRLSVSDNGSGFDPAGVTADHLGLKIMRERAESIGAKFAMDSEAGQGTQVSVVWQPLQAGPAAPAKPKPGKRTRKKA